MPLSIEFALLHNISSCSLSLLGEWERFGKKSGLNVPSPHGQIWSREFKINWENLCDNMFTWKIMSSRSTMLKLNLLISSVVRRQHISLDNCTNTDFCWSYFHWYFIYSQPVSLIWHTEMTIVKSAHYLVCKGGCKSWDNK